METPAGMPSARDVPPAPSADDVKKAASQFEAIILRQLLGPSIEPMMGGMGGGESGGAGAGVYSYLLTDVLCSKLGSSGGLGLGRMLERQLSTPATAATEAESTSSS